MWILNTVVRRLLCGGIRCCIFYEGIVVMMSVQVVMMWWRQNGINGCWEVATCEV